jgi:nucleotide-binding universal stress UspA family protein
MLSIHVVLHPTDFSPDSQAAFKVACALARDYRARLLLLHVMRPSGVPLGSPPPDPSRPAEHQEGSTGRPWPKPPDAGVPVEHRLAEGEPPEEILRLAEASHADIIVMGTHGRSGLRRLLLGSVAEEVLRQATCPVLIVKPGTPDPVTDAETSAAEPAEDWVGTGGA